mmetsp:Transcript_2464/g.3411  ORF Transcript_2464/g.3411 Transcript_2464/m.3411 type:complete len:325 (-) Transcript_2464:374-1348(-)
MSVAVLESEVLSLRNLGELLEECVADNLVHHLLGELLSVDHLRSFLVFDQVDQRFLLLGAEVGQHVHDLGEALLLGLMGLIASLGHEVQNADEVLELVGVGVDALEKGRAQVVLVIELGNLGLVVGFDARVSVPVLTSELGEEGVLWLALLGLRVLLSLSEIEGESEELLLVGGVQAELLDGSPVGGEASLHLFLDLLEGAEAGGAFGRDLVDELLQLVGVALDRAEVLRVAESNVFKTVDLAELPEGGAGVLAEALHAENFSEVGLLRDAAHHMVEELRLRQGILVVHGKEVKKLVFRRARRFGVLKEAEAANNVVLSRVSLT